MANPRQTLREWGAEPVPPNGRLGPEYSLQPPRARGFQGLYDTPAGVRARFHDGMCSSMRCLRVMGA